MPYPTEDTKRFLHSIARVRRLRDRARPSGRLREATLEANTVVDLPFAEIDPIFFHPDGLPLWDESVARVELLSAGPLRTGFRFDTIGPRHEKRSSYVATDLTPTMWRTKLINSRVLAEAVWTMHFEPLNDQTRVTCTVEMKFRRWCTPLALLFRRLTPGMNRDMRLLKDAIEQRHAA
jgi:hypothetical protein